MTAYELMLKTNCRLIQGGALTETQKAAIVRRLLAARSDERAKERYYSGVKFPGNIDAGGRRMYPEYFIPPYNGGKKYQTVIPMSPKTHILSANSYELEIIWLLHAFAPRDPDVKEIVIRTLARLKTTCFGYQNCAVGECFHAGLIVLRFLAAAAPAETEWMRRLVENYEAHFGDARRALGVTRYFWLCLSELPMEIAGAVIPRHMEQILRQLARGRAMKSGEDKAINPVIICALRNAAARLPEYSYIKDRAPYVSDKDGRLYFTMEKAV